METLIHRMKDAARIAGLDWSAVRAEYRARRAMESDLIARDREIRRYVYWQLTGNAASHWHRLADHFGHQFGDGDRNTIPAWDEMAQECASMFPELWSDDPGESVWNYVTAEPVRETDSENVYLDIIETHRDPDYLDVDSANVAFSLAAESVDVWDPAIVAIGAARRANQSALFPPVRARRTVPRSSPYTGAASGSNAVVPNYLITTTPPVRAQRRDWRTTLPPYSGERWTNQSRAGTPCTGARDPPYPVYGRGSLPPIVAMLPPVMAWQMLR